MNIDNSLVEICQYDGEGYRSLIFFEGWRVAILNHDEKFRRENTTFLERHNETDEVFVLLSGECSLWIGDGADDSAGCIRRVPLQPQKLYNVKKGVWHNLETSPGTSLLIVENATTSKENSRFLPVSPDMLPD